eukprot:scaffold41472_cov32-Phaeocystis_antarctica.AAC.1
MSTAPAPAAPALLVAAAAPCPFHLRHARWCALLWPHRLPHPAPRDVAFLPPQQPRTVAAMRLRLSWRG